MVKQSINKKSAPAKKKVAPKKKSSVKKKAVKRKAPAKKRASKRTSTKRKAPSRKSSTAKKRASSRKSLSKADTLHKDGSEKFTTSDELFMETANYGGRPTVHSIKMENRICALISMGYSLNKICSYADIPCISTVLSWLHDKTKEGFLDKYTRAHEMKTEIVEGELIDIADNVAQPVLIKGRPIIIKGEVIKVVDNASVQHARLRIDTRTRHMEVTKPKKWGKNIDLGQGIGGLLEMMDIAAGRLANFKEKQGAVIDGKTGKVIEE